MERQVRLLATLLVLLGPVACGRRPQLASTPVQMVHVAVPAMVTSETSVDPAGRKALEDLVSWIASRESLDVEAVILAGTFGLTPPAGAAPASAAEGPADASTSSPLSESPVVTIARILAGVPANIPMFIVPTGRTLAANETLPGALAATQQAIRPLQAELAKHGRTMRDLTACYAASTADGCSATLPGRSVRLVAFPAFALPGAENERLKFRPDQQKWAELFRNTLGTGAAGDRTVVIAPSSSPGEANWSSNDLRGNWMLAARRAVAVLGASPAPPPARTAYDAERGWQASNIEGRWFLTPPLFGVAGQRPAHGVSVVRIGDQVAQVQPVWYTPAASAFAFAQPVDVQRREWARSLWELGNLTPLTRAATFFIALLAAFLTVAAVWQIPAPDEEAEIKLTVNAQTSTAPGQTTTVVIPEPLVKKWAPAQMLQQNLTKTVMAGLGGLAVATLTLENLEQNGDVQAFYVVWFVLLFLILLVGSSAVRSFAEGVRAVMHVPLKRGLRRLPSGLALSSVTAIDVFFNLIQGKNQLKSSFWAKEIKQLQEDALGAVDAVCENLQQTIVAELKKQQVKVESDEVRVSVSVLSADKQRLFYVSQTRRSVSRDFKAASVAYVSVYASRVRWYVSTYAPRMEEITILANGNGTIPGKRMLKDHFQEREQDYTAFIVFPIPHRPLGRIRAGLHISFKTADQMTKIWTKIPTDPSTDLDVYKNADHLLDEGTSVDVLLKQSVTVIQSVLGNFNERVFDSGPREPRRS